MLSHFCLLLSLFQAWAIPQTSQDEVFICFQGKIHSEQSALALQFYTTLSSLVLTQPGFISQTPYYSIDQRGGQVLYVRFDNAEHLHAWKNLHVHLGIQAKGRADISQTID
jgi:antibiotic biosynthesis monooxygenase (ABM) superfamily enzyme